MSADDDQIRRALSADRPPFTAHAALQEMRPSMQQARMRRRVAVTATAAALLVIGGASAFALNASGQQSTLRSVTNDQSGQPLPAVTDVVVSSTIAPIEEPAEVIEEPAVTEEPTTVAPAAPAPDNGDEPTTERVELPPPAVAVPAIPVPEEPAPASPPPASFQTITSSCGEIVVSIDAGTVRIVTITAQPGFVQRVADDGPTSIEMTFNGEGDRTCELHAELKASGLDVEVHDLDTGSRHADHDTEHLDTEHHDTDG